MIPNENIQLTPWSIIQKQYSSHDHHLKLICAKCGNTVTCRCIAPKKEVIGICDNCVGKK